MPLNIQYQYNKPLKLADDQYIMQPYSTYFTQHIKHICILKHPT